MDAAGFARLSERLERGDTAVGDELVAMRGTSGAVGLARDVLEGAFSVAAQFQAVLLLRESVLRAWPTIPPQDKAAIRDWSLSKVANNHSSMASAVSRQYVVACAVMWKRGWLEEDGPSRGRLFEHVHALFRGDVRAQAVAANLCYTLVEEFSVGSGSGAPGPWGCKVTALGLPATFHKHAAASFAEYGLREAAHAASTCMLSRMQECLSPGGPGAACLLVDLFLPILATLASALTYSHTGTAGATTPGRAWADLLADPQHTLLTACFALYGAIRPDVAVGGPLSPLAAPLRALLTSLCTLSGEVFLDVARKTGHAQAAVQGLLSLLSTPFHDQAASLAASCRAAGRMTTGDDVSTAGDAEVLDLAAALAGTVRVHTLAGIAGLHAPPGTAPIIDPSPVFTATAELAGKLLAPFHGAAVQLTAQHAARGTAGGAVDKAGLRQAKSALEHALVHRYTDTMGAVDGLLGVWSSGVVDLEVGSGPWVEQTRHRLLQPARGLYERLVHTRLSWASALILCEVDDDDPYEDESGLTEHMEYVAAVGRLAGASTSAMLADLLQAQCGQMHALVTAGGHAHAPGDVPLLLSRPPSSAHTHVGGDPDKEMEVSSDVLWWLLGYAGHLLADEARGERPTVPAVLNALSKASGRVTSGAGGGSSAALHSDPVIRLSMSALTVAHLDLARLCSDPVHVSGLSPLLSRQVSWFLARWGQTYILPAVEDRAHAGASLSPNLTAAYGTGTEGAFTSDSLRAMGPSVLRVLPTPVGVLGGRQALELCVTYASVVLGVWAGGHGEAHAANAAFAILRSISNRDETARYAMLSPALSSLAQAFAGVIASPEEAGAAAGALTRPGPGLSNWPAVLPLLARLPAVNQQTLCSLLLSLTPRIAFECSGYEQARSLTTSGEAAGEAWADMGSGALTPGFQHAFPALVEPVSRWLAYYRAFTLALQARYASVLAQPALGAALAAGGGGGPPADPRLSAELERLLCLHTGVLRASSCMPDAWHLPATLSCLSSCPALVSSYRGAGPVVLQVLRFTLAFMDCADWTPVEAGAAHVGAVAARNEAVYGAVTGVFERFAQCHGSGGGGAVRVGTPGLATQEDEEEVHGDVLLLLAILQAVGEKESTDFNIGGGSVYGSTTDVSSPASVCMFVGLSFLVPLVTRGMLDYPRTAAAYMNVVSLVLGRQPAMAARLDPALFATFVSSLEYGLRHPEVEVVQTALEAVKGMAVCHAGARRKGGAFAALDLSAQLVGMPDLFSRFLRPLLGLVLGPAPPPAPLLAPAAAALLATIQADPSGYQAGVQALLASQADRGLSASLAAEFTALTSGQGLDLSHTFPGAAPPLAVRAAKSKFSANFEGFVSRVRGLTTIV